MEQVAGSRRQPYWILRPRTVKERMNKSIRGSAAVSGHVLHPPSPVGHSTERCWPGSPRTAQHEDSGDRGLRRDDRASLGTAMCTAVAAVGMTDHVIQSQLVSCPGTIRSGQGRLLGAVPRSPASPDPPLAVLGNCATCARQHAHPSLPPAPPRSAIHPRSTSPAPLLLPGQPAPLNLGPACSLL